MTAAIKLHHFVTECMSFYTQDKTSKRKRNGVLPHQTETVRKKEHPVTSQ